MEGEAPSSETCTSLDSPSAYHQDPLAPGSSLNPDHYEHTSVGAYGLYSGPLGQRTRRPKLQHSTSILRKQAEEEAIKRSRSLSESYELSSDLQDKQVGGACLLATWEWAAGLMGETQLGLAPCHYVFEPPLEVCVLVSICDWASLCMSGEHTLTGSPHCVPVNVQIRHWVGSG